MLSAHPPNPDSLDPRPPRSAICGSLPARRLEEQHKSTATKKRKVYYARVDEGRKRVIGIIAGILVANHMDVADDLFGGPQGSPRTDKMIAAAVKWAELILFIEGAEIEGPKF
jgi:hypothetical protein